MSRFARWSAAGIAMVVAATGLYSPPASAHGEKSQQAFMRMRTIQWYDLNWSTDKLKVNEEMTVSGKFHVFAGWPESVRPPRVAFLNIGIPGPVFTRQASFIGGKFVPRSVELQLGKDYTFKVVLKARRPGRWHTHTMINVESGGPIIGPGKWVTIDGNMADYKNPITTLTGNTLDVETFGAGSVWGWHVFWFAMGVAFIGYWAAKPLFIPRWIRTEAGEGDAMITKADTNFGIAVTVATVLITLFGYTSATAEFPITAPLQAGVLREIPPIPDVQKSVELSLESATYRVPGRAFVMTLRVTNRGANNVQLAEVMVGGVRFLNASIMKDTTGYPDNLLAPEGLTLDDNQPIAPGQSKVLTVTAADAAWEQQRLADIIYDPDSRFGGLAMFLDSGGYKHVIPIGGPMVPRFS
jgi:methane/ammonia monooxygenase subunit B